MGHKLSLKNGDLLEDAQMYLRLVGKLISLTITRLDISQPVSMVSQYMHAPQTSHLETVRHILRYIKSSLGKGIFYAARGHLNIVGYSYAGLGRFTG